MSSLRGCNLSYEDAQTAEIALQWFVSSEGITVHRDDAGQQTDSAPHSDPKGSIVLSASCQGIGRDTRDGTGLQARWPGRIRQQRQLSICGRASLHSRYSNIGVLLSDRPLILLWGVVVQYVSREHSTALSGSTVRADSTNQERPSAISAEHGNICTQSATHRCDASFDQFDQSTVVQRRAGRIKVGGCRTCRKPIA